MIRIFKGEYEIEVVKDTLTLKKENKFMDNDFKIQSNSFPFLIIENQSTRIALGSQASTSLNRKQYHEIQVITPEGNFVGELQILTYTKNFRKCNIRFYSPLYNIKDNNINSFLPERISTVVNSSIHPLYSYEEKRSQVIEPMFSNTWAIFAPTITIKSYPETLFNLPSIQFPNKYGEDLDEDEDWFYYNGVINHYFYDNGNQYASYNNYSINNGVTFNNITVNAPKVYMLAPIKKAVESVGYKLIGSFPNSNFIKKILLDSENDNLTEIKIDNLVTTLPYPINWVSQNYGLFIKRLILPSLQSGKKYRVEIELKKVTNDMIVCNMWTASTISSNVVGLFQDVQQSDEFQIFSAEINTVPSMDLNNLLIIEFSKFSFSNIEPIIVNYIKVFEISNNTGFSTHPIINLQRFCPDWSFIQYLNELKNLFNLKITTDDHEKTISMDFFEDKFLSKTGVFLESVLVENFDSVEFDSILLKYDNDDDDSIYVDNNGVQVGKLKPREHTKEIQTKFKYLPVTSQGLIMNEEIEDKNGVGLMIFNGGNFKTGLSENFTQNENNQLKIYDLTLKNIFEKFHRISFQNYLSGGVFPVKTVLTNKQIKEVSKEDFVFIDNKRYYVNSMEYKETNKGLFDVNFELLLMLY